MYTYTGTHIHVRKHPCVQTHTKSQARHLFPERQQESSVKSEATIVGRNVPKVNPSNSQSRSYPDEPQTHSACGMHTFLLDTLSLGCNQRLALVSYHLPLGFLFRGACYYLLPPG